MLKFFRKIRRNLLTQNKFSKYLFYAIGEILLVVIGILIALQINNWNNGRIERKEEEKSYLNIRRQIIDDKNDLLKVMEFNNYFTRAYQYGIKLIISGNRSKIDSLALVTMSLSQFSDFHNSGNIYQTLVNSGDLKLLKNSKITSAVQKLETTYVFANKLENIHWELIINELSPELKGVIDYTTVKAVAPDKLYSIELQNIYYEIIELSKLKNTIYEQALTEIDSITTYIDQELSPPIIE